MFAHLFATIRTAVHHSCTTSRHERDLAVLKLAHRSQVQEQEAREVETRLFFDTDLLAAAANRNRIGFALTKTLLASFAGVVLLFSPYIAYSEDDTENPAASSGSSADTSEEAALLEQFEAWLVENGLLDEGAEDPTEGER